MMRPAQPETRRQPERDLPSGSARAIKPAALGSRDLTMYRSVGEFAHHVRQRAQAGDLSGALETIRDLVVEIIVRDSSYANVFASAEIDGLCVELGRQKHDTVCRTIRDRDQSAFLVTSLARMARPYPRPPRSRAVWTQPPGSLSSSPMYSVISK